MIFDVGLSLMLGIVFVYLRIRKIIAGYQTELEASQEQAQKARQEKDELMRNMAHDLRTPLTAIRGTIKGLMDGIAATPEMQEKFCRLHTVGPEIWTDF